ncbi:MAG: hypothetical protein ACO3UU_07505 [Minisyncoccia bacterium]
MYTDELKQLQNIFNDAIESEKRVQKFIQNRLQDKCKVKQDDIILEDKN